MADFVFNRSKGRIAEFAERVNANDPTNAIFVIAAVVAGGDSDATMRDRDDFAALFGGTANEAANGGYARKTLDQAGGITVTYDDTNDWVDVDVPDQTFSAVAAGDVWTDLVFGYDADSTGGTDANIIPMTLHDFPVTPDGSDITVQIPTAGFFRSS